MYNHDVIKKEFEKNKGGDHHGRERRWENQHHDQSFIHRDIAYGDMLTISEMMETRSEKREIRTGNQKRAPSDLA